MGQSDPGDMVLLIAKSGTLVLRSPEPLVMWNCELGSECEVSRNAELCDILFRLKVEECIVSSASGTHRRRQLSSMCTLLGSCSKRGAQFLQRAWSPVSICEALGG